MIRKATRVISGMPATDGAGVNLTRVLGTPLLDYLDPFLLLDEFKSDNPDDYIGGFPSHPHRGFETVTYLLHGRFRHRDSRGNEGLLTAGSVQWMTAGRGIIHSEMPEIDRGLLWGFQLWVNLPRDKKMIEPRYQDIPGERIPEAADNGVRVRVISGDYGGETGPAETHIAIQYLDVRLEDSARFSRSLPMESNCFCYVYEGVAGFGPAEELREVRAGDLVILGEGDSVEAYGRGGGRFLFLAGMPLGEPVARAGPFVMNTEGELRQAFLDYRNGTLDR
ncbi:MAG: pirin family protein [Fidelibacterota bacterium]